MTRNEVYSKKFGRVTEAGTTIPPLKPCVMPEKYETEETLANYE